MEKIAVIGAGLMGHGIAQVFAVKGHEVAIHDPFPEVLARVPERVRANLRSLGLDESSVERISLHGTLKAAVERADIVFEAAPENLALKQDIFARLSTSTRPGCILASNTSVIPIGEIAAKSEDPGRILGTHWWNPPYLIPLVEVIQAPRTESVYIEKCIDLLQRAGKVAVHVKRDVPGICRQPFAARALERSNLHCGGRNLRCRNGRSRGQKQLRDAVACVRTAGECGSCGTRLDSRDPQCNSSPS